MVYGRSLGGVAALLGTQARPPPKDQGRTPVFGRSFEVLDTTFSSKSGGPIYDESIHAELF